MMTSKRLLAVAVSAALYAPLSVFATNGMNMDGYGPISTGMGGTSMAFDNGTAAMMNNPATLSMMADGNRLDVAVAGLHPDVDVSAMGMNWPSQSDAFYMPAVGWAHKSGALTFGAGAFAQGGMGAEYEAMAPGAAFVFAPAMMGGGGLSTGSAIAPTVMGWDEMSEVGVMRILFPVSYQVSNKMSVGGSVDFVRATMDLKMAMPGGMMMDMMPTIYNPLATQSAGTLSGSMVDALAGEMGAGNITGLYGGYFDFADDNPFTGKTEGSGFAGKLGFTYKATDKMTIGGTYHSKTSLGDLEGDATVSMAIATPGGDMVMPVNGTVKIKDFQWPTTYGLGFAYQENDKLMVAMDLKRILWSDVMKDFKMSFTASDSAFAGTTLDAVMYQKWGDQTVVQAGLAYKATNALTVRAGANVSANPIPASTLHYLFPATVKDHYTMGFGYMLNQASDVNFSFTYAPPETVTTPMGMTISHSQTSWQLMYSNRF